jgi:heme-degrading monooxygenase HmoA
MVLEHALLPVRPGQEASFEAAFATARPLITGHPGCRSLTLARGVESPSTYVLLVQWDSVEAHTEGFRQSAAYEEWRRLLHHFYEPFPTVEHFAEVAPAD